MGTEGRRTDRQRIHDDLERVRADLHELVAGADATDSVVARRMHFPVGWDPFFRDTMTSE